MDKPYISKRVKVAIVGIDKGLGVSATRALQRLLQRNDANTPEKENDISVSPSSSLPEVEVINFRLVSVEEPTEAVDVATAAQVVADELKEMTSLLPTSGNNTYFRTISLLFRYSCRRFWGGGPSSCLITWW
jgi:hypothetical protein